MTRALLVPFPPAGHTEPMDALASRLREDGHDVTLFTESPHTRWGRDRPVPAELYAHGDAGALFRRLFLGDVVDMTLDIVELADACDAEVIVSDVMMPGGGLAAELARLPWASLSCSPLPVLDHHRTFLPEHVTAAFDPNSTREELGLPLDDERSLLGRTSDRLHLIPSTPRFAGYPALAPEVALVGPLTRVPPEVGRPGGVGRPTVVISGSTHTLDSLGGRMFLQDRFLGAAVEALGGLEVTGLVTHAVDGSVPAHVRVPANVRVLGPTPHEGLFDTADAVVTHAGWGTVSRALVRGLPLVLVPISGDQPYIAARCAELGLGVALEAETVTAEKLRSAVRAVTEEPRYRLAAAELAAELRAAAPLATAGSMISSFRVTEG
ncbi:glycosyltransferase [Streptomyces sp. AK08-02]|uniref:glycosyltransferase n=1 Tax=Streptomyces sp. AK08-02 TaxID=3028654 RepID=UPI0029BE0497|nr:glycosyltransferase [Streptomyces sp. AK08-02]MDX3749118.1 glycosyltransferase [Streptomyces sp. AK08-02]